MAPPSGRLSLQHSITLAILLISVLCGTLVLSFSYWQARQALQTTIGLHFQELARHSADKLSLILTKELHWIERFSMLPDVRNAITHDDRLSLRRPGLQEWRDNQRHYFRSLALITQDGRLAGGIASKSTRDYYAQQPWWPVVFEQGRAWTGDIQVGPKGQGFWEVVVPIRHEDQSVIGALKVSVGTDTLFDPALRLSIGETGNLMLVNETGSVLLCPVCPASRHTRIEGFTNRGNNAGPNWVEVQEDGHGQTGGIIGMATVNLEGPIVQAKTWQMVVRQDPQETFAPVYSMMWKLGGFWLVTTILLTLIGSRVSSRLIHPLNTLIDYVPRLGEAQTPPPLNVTGPQEIQTLSETFKGLAERLRMAKQETRHYVRELEQTNQKLSVSNDHYRTLWDHAVDCMLIIDMNGTIQDINHRGEHILAQPSSQIVGKPSSVLVIEEDRQHFTQCLEHVLTTKNEHTGSLVHVRLKDGPVLTMEAALVPMVMDGAIPAILVQLTDVTEKRHLEQQLIRSEQLASLSQFASMFAHDIRNPLAGTKKTLELLYDQPELTRQPVRQMVTDLQFTTNLLLGMINDMLDVYQETYMGLPLNISRFSVKPLLEEVSHLFKGEAEALGMTIRVLGPKEALFLPGDRRRLQRAMINFVHNALKYSPTQGIITLSVLSQHDPLSSAEPTHKQSSKVIMTVEDEGTGIDPLDLPHLFEMFFKKKDGKDLRIGRGLGLHFCKLVVEAHQGQIWVENRHHGGARFYVALPMKRNDCPDTNHTHHRRGSTSIPAELAAST